MNRVKIVDKSYILLPMYKNIIFLLKSSTNRHLFIELWVPINSGSVKKLPPICNYYKQYLIHYFIVEHYKPRRILMITFRIHAPHNTISVLTLCSIPKGINMFMVHFLVEFVDDLLTFKVT